VVVGSPGVVVVLGRLDGVLVEVVEVCGFVAPVEDTTDATTTSATNAAERPIRSGQSVPRRVLGRFSSMSPEIRGRATKRGDAVSAPRTGGPKRCAPSG
jgi:hypothetical protein